MNNETPWWWPQIIDDDYIDQLRKDYPEQAYMDDEELLDYFDEGKLQGEVSTMWDDVGDAYEDYARLAREFLKLVKETGKNPSDFDDF